MAHTYAFLLACWRLIEKVIRRRNHRIIRFIPHNDSKNVRREDGSDLPYFRCMGRFSEGDQLSDLDHDFVFRVEPEGMQSVRSRGTEPTSSTASVWEVLSFEGMCSEWGNDYGQNSGKNSPSHLLIAFQRSFKLKGLVDERNLLVFVFQGKRERQRPCPRVELVLIPYKCRPDSFNVVSGNATLHVIVSDHSVKFQISYDGEKVEEWDEVIWDIALMRQYPKLFLDLSVS